MKGQRIYLLVLLLICFKITSAQQLLLPLGDGFAKTINFELNKSNKEIHTGFKPVITSDIIAYKKLDSILYDLERKETFFKRHKKNWIWRKLLFEDFVIVKKEDFSLYINPLLYLEYGRTSDTAAFFINTRSIEIKGNIGKKLSYYSSFRENQARFRPYIYEWSQNRLVVPGQGALKTNNKDLSLYDFSGVTAYLSYSLLNTLNVQVGQGKIFIGEGHRSLFISDNTYTYPYAKISFKYKNFKYTSLFTQFRDFEDVYYSLHNRKHGAFNYLSYNYKNRFEIGLFEGMIYKTTDSSNYINRFKYDFFIPVIGLKSITTGFQNEHNLLAGVNAKLKVIDHIQLYGQFALDDPKRKKYAYQGGLKIFDLFFSKIDDQRLYFQTEYNLAKARTYSHTDNSYQTWSHYNQELAHPAGSDFLELYSETEYSILNFRLNYRFNDVRYNRSSSYSDIMITDKESYLLSPDPVRVLHHTFMFSFIINPRTNLQVYAGYNKRKITGENGTDENYYMIGLRTGISNFYYDF